VCDATTNKDSPQSRCADALLFILCAHLRYNQLFVYPSTPPPRTASANPTRWQILVMACGFAKPVLGMIPVFAVALVLPSATLVVGWLVGFGLMFMFGDLVARWRARLQTARWCREHGFGNPRWPRRGGFVSWGWSIWSFCEMLPCEFEDADGITHKVVVDVCAPVFGLFVFSQVNGDFGLPTRHGRRAESPSA